MIPSVPASQVQRGVEDFLRTTFLRISGKIFTDSGEVVHPQSEATLGR